MIKRLLLPFLLTASFAGCAAGAIYLSWHPTLPDAGVFSHLLLGMALFFLVPAVLLWVKRLRD